MPNVDAKEIEEKLKDAVKKAKEETLKLLKTCPNINSKHTKWASLKHRKKKKIRKEDVAKWLCLPADEKQRALIEGQ